MNLKTHKSSKLFYGTYLYKLQVRTPVSILFTKPQNSSIDYKKYNGMLGLFGSKNELNITRWKIATRQNLVDAKVILDKLISTNVDYKLRCEAYSLVIYANDEDLLASIADGLSFECRAKIWKPEKTAEEFLLTNKNIVISKNPVEFPYKVYLKHDSSKQSYDALVKWLTANPEKCKVGRSTLENLENNYYFSGNYFYVKDLKVLMIIEMVAGKIIGRIDKVIHIDDIDK